MKKILLVEDDAVVSRIYSLRLSQAGFDVTVSKDGLEAMRHLPIVAPDLVVLDILMPKLSGVDVLKFIREHPQLKSTRVIVFSNAFLDNTGEKLAAMGVDEMVLKSAVTPQQLLETIHRILKSSETAPAAQLRETAGGSRSESATEFSRRIRREFFEQIPTINRTLKQAADEFVSAGASDRTRKLEAFSRKVGFLTHMTGMAGCHRIAQLSSAFEALLFEFQEKPSSINDSTLHTTQTTVELLCEALSRADRADEQCLSPTNILLVDDDAVSNRALLFALGRYRLKTVSVLDPIAALDLLKQTTYDVVLLDINLPCMDGITLCQRMRELPIQQETPVIFLTSYMEFVPRAKSILRNGDDLIAKPVLPIELTVKVIARCLRRRLAAPAAGHS